MKQELINFGRMRRVFALMLSCLLLIAPSVSIIAQQAIPTPSPSAVIRDATEAVQTLGPLAVILLLAVIILGGIVVFFIISVLRGAAPLLNTVTRLLDTVGSLQRNLETERQGRELAEKRYDDLTQERREVEVQAQSLRTQQAGHLERVGNILSDLETREQAAQGRKDAITQITEHVTEQIEPLNQGIGDIKKTVDAAIERLDKLATRDDLKGVVDPITEELKTVSKRVGDLETVVRDLVTPPAASSAAVGEKPP